MPSGASRLCARRAGKGSGHWASRVQSLRGGGVQSQNLITSGSKKRERGNVRPPDTYGYVSVAPTASATGVAVAVEVDASRVITNVHILAYYSYSASIAE